jgi:hypothetical protein
MIEEDKCNGMRTLSQQIADLKELLSNRIDYIEKLTAERFSSDAKALELEAKELARRLDGLNDEAERLRRMQETYVPREIWEKDHKELQRQVEELRLYKSNEEGKQYVIYAIVGFIVLLLSIAANYLLFMVFKI